MAVQTFNSDLFVAGAGPAGLALAILAARRGLRVIVADHACPPIDKACGEGLMPNSVSALADIGIRLTHGHASVFRGIKFLERTTRTSVAAKFSSGPGMAIRRTVLHDRLLQHAAEAGVSLAWGARVTPAGNELECDGVKIRSRWIIGADGEHSKIRRFAGLSARRYERVRFGSRQHFRIVPWTDFVEVYWGKTCQIVVTPIGSEEIGVAVVARDSHVRVATALKEVPELGQRLAGAPAVSRERGARCALRFLRRVYRERFALIGDASGSADPLTGEGLGLGFRQAAALADALAANDLARYQSAHEEIGRMSRIMSRLMLSMDRHQWFRDRVLRSLMAEPELFSRLVATHIEALSPSAFGIGNAMLLGWRFVSTSAVEI
jgi:flavin-dependent dehydrogenase